ncbi:transposase [Daejeonella sp.]|uniref:transposase n=1 Tax=Daejeonella sp. TaxID=2805397 RepID=UPI0026B0E611|nr:transposase [Daejeonella sp.]HQS06603.1 transposase [Daejeonella sp.]HQT24246.1 transposase [Daejeonella sp.]HQT59092.1 transposase [Daejeonella sp.]
MEFSTGVDWVTRLRADSNYEVTGEQLVTDQQKALGVLSDQHIKLGFKNNVIQQVDARLVRYYDQDNKREFAFITNNRTWEPYRVAEIYKKRWQIELLFKRLKQNMPLTYFLGDNENAIKIQIYCALIADLILKMATNGIKRKWAFSNLASIVRLHLMHYTSLRKFLEQPDKCHIRNPVPDLNPQLKLNLSG